MKEGWKSSSKRWGNGGLGFNNNGRYSNGGGACWKEMDGVNMYSNGNSEYGSMKKRVMVVVDDSSRSKHAMMWALTHVTNKGDWLTLLHIISDFDSSSSSPNLASSLGSLCKACKPEVWPYGFSSELYHVESTLLDPNSLFGMSNSENFVEQCINNAECLTIGVRKQSKGMGGYLISTRWQKNFWLLA
ncbi:hypothetical protein KSS87_012421 [Heliosperma pusillum]|nr:hypothetical protein KSS87_012421 [Heliosperma pusillum]